MKYSIISLVVFFLVSCGQHKANTETILKPDAPFKIHAVHNSIGKWAIETDYRHPCGGDGCQPEQFFGVYRTGSDNRGGYEPNDGDTVLTTSPGSEIQFPDSLTAEKYYADFCHRKFFATDSAFKSQHSYQ